ncbi:SpoVR family protein [Halobacteriales archaeon QS_4_69_225]|nr:MAG: SpoVR family protein [Halobacteriales archaeon QS_4_69_225]
MSTDDRIRKQRIAEELEEPAREANRLAEKLGLEPFDVNYWVIDYDEMNELIAYGGFQHRYPHWRWGMGYDRQQKQTQFLGGKAFEIVNNDDPSNAFLQESNDMADQKAVITHVEAHADFFKNNEWFRMFGASPDAAAMLERHSETVAEYMDDPEISREAVEEWIDHVLCLEDNVDQHREFSTAQEWQDDAATPEEFAEKLEEMDLSEDVRREVFDEEFVDEMSDDDGGPTTKVMNEGWACVDPDTPVFSTAGLVPMRDVVDGHRPVSDGETTRDVYDSNVIEGHDTVTVETRRGFELTGSNNHRIRRPDGSWIRLDELSTGDEIAVSGGNGTWPDEYVPLEWSNPTRKTLDDVAETAGVSVSTVLRYRRTGRARRADEISTALESYAGEDQSISGRDPILTPEEVREPMGRFLGLLVGDGHLSSNSRHVGFTSGTQEHAEEFAGLVDELFGVQPTVSEQGSRWRVYAYSENLKEFLTEEVGLPVGEAAGEKTVPACIRRSPKSVVAEFIRGLFDADGYAGEQGAILSTKSEALGKLVQLLLTNFGVLSRRREQHDGCYHVHLTGESASVFADEIGFGYPSKADALAEYLDGLEWFEDESWTDEIVAIEEGTGTVYDISVEETHRYAAAGLVNHNSYHESMMMADERFAAADEFISYADHMAQVLGSPGLNPYKLGFELWQYIENRQNRREVVEHLLRVEGVTWRNFSDTVDLDAVLSALEPAPEMADPVAFLEELEADDPRVDAENLEAARAGEIDVEQYPWKLLTYEGLAERHYSLAKPQNRGFLKRVGQEELEQTSRYLFDTGRYDDAEAAVADVDRTAGWNRMREIRESHNDVTFLDEFLTPEFVDENDYFTYEYTHTTQDFRVTSSEAADVKKKLMLQFTNFGKPTVAVEDGNFRNRNELLLAHQYNGVQLDVREAKQTLERVFELWGRPVALKTVVKELDEHDIEVARRRDKEPEPTEQGKLIRFDGESFETEDLPDEEIENIAATEIDYDTKPDDWL